MNTAYELGKKGEDYAVLLLTQHHLNILERNWRIHNLEIDIIAESSNYIHIIEVKTRSSNIFGNPEVFIGMEKQKNLIKAANFYVRKKGIFKEIHFDIISIICQKNDYTIEWIEDAFMPRCH